MTQLRQTEIQIFFLLGYEMLRGERSDGTRYKSCHSVWSGFNEAFRTYFSTEDVVERTKQLHCQGLIKTFLAKGGVFFQPTPDLLRQATKAEGSIAKRIRQHLARFMEEREAKVAVKKAERTSIEEQAELLWAGGKTDEALKLLGY